jgi:hypothetical protein
MKRFLFMSSLSNLGADKFKFKLRYIATNGQLASSSWCWAHLWGRQSQSYNTTDSQSGSCIYFPLERGSPVYIYIYIYIYLCVCVCVCVCVSYSDSNVKFSIPLFLSLKMKLSTNVTRALHVASTAALKFKY